MREYQVQFSIGQIVHHKLLDYRGVVTDVDGQYLGSDEWYETMTVSNPPKNQPWYHVLVDESDLTTYVAQRNLELDESLEPIHHPELDSFFNRYENGRYLPKQETN